MKRVTVLIHPAGILLRFLRDSHSSKFGNRMMISNFRSPVERYTGDEILFKCHCCLCYIITSDGCMTDSSYPSRKVKGAFWNELFLGYNDREMKLILFELFINSWHHAKCFVCYSAIVSNIRSVKQHAFLSSVRKLNVAELSYSRAQSGCTWVSSSSWPHISACNSHLEELILNKSQKLQSRHFPLISILMNILV